MTGESAEDRVLFINIGIFRFGTDDRVQAAAVFFSIILLIMICGVLIAAGGVSTPWNDKVFAWLGGAFLFVAGIALGKGSNGKADD